jgi:hypothetical protein
MTAQCMHPPEYIISKVFSPESATSVIPEVEIIRCMVHNEWCMGRNSKQSARMLLFGAFLNLQDNFSVCGPCDKTICNTWRKQSGQSKHGVLISSHLELNRWWWDKSLTCCSITWTNTRLACCATGHPLELINQCNTHPNITSITPIIIQFFHPALQASTRHF